MSSVKMRKVYRIEIRQEKGKLIAIDVDDANKFRQERERESADRNEKEIPIVIRVS